MSKRQTTQHIGVAKVLNKAITMSQLKKYSKNLIDYLEYHGKKNNWRYKILIIGSNVDGCLGEMIKISNGRGRPKKQYIPFPPIVKKGIPWEKDPHIHFIIKANPGSTIIKQLNTYWEKNLDNGKDSFNYEKSDGGLNGKSYIDYMENQEIFRAERKMGYVGNWQ